MGVYRCIRAHMGEVIHVYACLYVSICVYMCLWGPTCVCEYSSTPVFPRAFGVFVGVQVLAGVAHAHGSL